MDARMPVTHKEGDRYPLEPPILFRCSTAVVQLTVNQLVVGSIPATGAIFRIHSAIKKTFYCQKRKADPVVFSPCSAVGSALALGAWGREFEPLHGDHILAFVDGVEKDKLSTIWAGSDNGSTVALQASSRGSIPLRSTI